jgi:sulfopyruvate decarboxylase beta subunit
MRRPEEELITILKEQGVDFTCSLPCEKIKTLLEIVSKTFFHVPLTREEDGVGICAGAALAARRPAMFVQSSGMGNMINALLSLTGFYKLPLAIFVSRRGVYKEKIAAQVPMGSRLPTILRGAGVPYSIIASRNDFQRMEKRLAAVYKRSELHAFLLSPAIWEASCESAPLPSPHAPRACVTICHGEFFTDRGNVKPTLTRFEVIDAVAPYLDSKVVVCNLGFPSKELFYVRHQPSNFYMLGSMGMATPIGLGVSLTSEKRVIVIDGDGSLLMNPGTLATVAHFAPDNLTILAIDNGSYGSTGGQPTLTRSCVDLALIARGFGIENSFRVSTTRHIRNVLKDDHMGLKFIHIPALPGNRDVPNIPLDHLTIKQQVQRFLGSR